MNIGLVGNGMIIPDILSQIKSIPEMECIAICGREKSSFKLQQLAKDYTIRKVYYNYEELLEDSEIDVIYVAIVNSLHYEYSLKALNAGKHVICEKPFALKYEEAKKLKEIAEGKKLFLFEAITARHMPAYIQLFDIIEEIGNIKAVFCNLSKYSSRYDDFAKGETPNVFNPSLGGGALEDINIYNIHFCVGLFGEPMEVSYYANVIRDIDVSGTLILKYDNFTALCVGAKNNNVGTGIFIQGEKGAITFNEGSYAITRFNIFTKGSQRAIISKENKRHRMFFELSEFLRIIREKKYDQCYSNLEDTLKVVMISEEARKFAGLNF